MIKKLAQFHTAKTVCGKLQISRGTLSNLMKRGEIRYVKIGKAVRFNEQDILNFIDAKSKVNVS